MAADNTPDFAEARKRLEAERVQLADQEARLRAEADDEEWRSPKPDEADQGAAAVERERLKSLAEQAREGLRRIDAALKRVEDGTYGHCASCGRAIPEARLEARPDADLCVECASGARRAP